MEYYLGIKKTRNFAFCKHGGGQTEETMLTKISQKEKDKSCVISLIFWNITNKTNEQTETVIHTEYKQEVPEESGGKREVSERDKEVQTFNCKIKEHRYEMYSVGNKANNYILSLYRDWW